MNGGTRPPILVVEDENVVMTDLLSSLEKLEYPIAGVAASAEQAVALARTQEPALVLMDMHLHGSLDGVRAAQQIQDELLIPVVYLTAMTDEATLEKARATHPFGYVLKPFEDREIDVAVQVALFRHQMERALLDSERRLDSILSSIGDAVIATDVDKRVTFLNRAAEKLLGHSSKGARGRPLCEVLRCTTDNPRCIPRGNSSMPVELVESPVLDAGGKPAGYVTIARDISESLRAQESHDRELIERAARAAVERENERARLKSEITLILGDITQYAEASTTLRRVAELIAQTLANWCVLHIEDGREPLRITAHLDPDKLAWAEDLIHRWPPKRNGPSGPYAVMRTGKPELVRAISDDALVAGAQDPEHLAALRKANIVSWLCVPLRARHRLIGSLALVSTEAGHHYGESDVLFAQQVADRIAFAFDNSRLYREAQEAKTTAERLYEAEQRSRAEAEGLLRVAEVVTGAQLDLEALVQRVTCEATSLVGAQAGAFVYHADGGESSSVLCIVTDGRKEVFDTIDALCDAPILAATVSDKRVVRVDDTRNDPRFEMPPIFGMASAPVSYLAVPVVSQTNTAIGGLFFGHQDPAKFTEQHERMARAVAAHAATAIDNARLFGETRAAEKQQGRLVEKLERAVRFSEMFVGVLGHDLRNPLSGITTAASLVLYRAKTERITGPVRRILSSADRMSRMIDQILDFTHVRLGGGIPLRRTRVDLAAVCRQVVGELTSDAEGGADVRLETAGDTVGSWDEDRLAQLISNLAGNAAQHRVPGTRVNILVDGSQADRMILCVDNVGVVAPEILPVIFEPLRSRGRYNSSEGSSGLGLGLYISQQIAAAHGGVIRVDSPAESSVGPESGHTLFSLDLPRSPPGEAKDVFGASGGEGELG